MPAILSGTQRDNDFLVICLTHYNDAIMGMMVSQITSLTIVYPTVYSGA